MGALRIAEVAALVEELGLIGSTFRSGHLQAVETAAVQRMAEGAAVLLATRKEKKGGLRGSVAAAAHRRGRDLTLKAQGKSSPHPT